LFGICVDIVALHPGYRSTVPVAHTWRDLGLLLEAQLGQVLTATLAEGLALLWRIDLGKADGDGRCITTAGAKGVPVGDADDYAKQESIHCQAVSRIAEPGRYRPEVGGSRVQFTIVIDPSTGNAMTKITAALVLALVALPVFADNTCDAQAADKKLAGAAKTSFLKKCNADAAKAPQAACDAQATEKKLSGAAKTSFTKKCVRDASAAASAPKQ